MGENKTMNEFIKDIDVVKSNLDHVASTGIINGSLLGGIRDAMRLYAELIFINIWEI